MENERATWLVVNTGSGSNDEDAIAAVTRALGEAGANPARTIDAARESCPDGGALAAEHVELLAIFAGDGTINGQLARLGGWTGQVLVLPGGTANLLSHALHGESVAEEIAGRLNRLRPVRRHGIRCSRGTALIEILAGPGAVWSDVREGLREGDPAQVFTTAVEAARQSVAGPMVRICEPSLGLDAGYSGIRLVPCERGIEVAGYGAETLGDYLQHGSAILARDYRDGPHDELGLHDELACRSVDGSVIELMIDGERRTGMAEERFSLVELPVKLLAGR